MLLLKGLGTIKCEWQHSGAAQTEMDTTVRAEEEPKKEWGSSDVSPTFCAVASTQNASLPWRAGANSQGNPSPHPWPL